MRAMDVWLTAVFVGVQAEGGLDEVRVAVVAVSPLKTIHNHASTVDPHDDFRAAEWLDVELQPALTLGITASGAGGRLDRNRGTERLKQLECSRSAAAKISS